MCRLFNFKKESKEMEKKKLRLLVCALAIGLTAGLANADIETGLVGHWMLDDGFGTTATDSSANNNHGTLTAGTVAGLPEWRTTGDDFKMGIGALAFEDGGGDLGQGNYVDCGADPVFNITENATVALWVKIDAFTARYQYVFSKGDALIIIRSGNSSYFNACFGLSGNYYVTGTTAIDDGQWHHVAMSYDSSTGVKSIYTDGTLDASLVADVGGPLSTNSESLCIGMRPTRKGTNAIIDDVRVYSRTLDADDIMDLFSYTGDPDYNYTPRVDAGEYQSILWPGSSLSVQLDATASDDGRPYQPVPPADPCTPVGLTLTWSKISGPGDVTFDPCNAVEDPTATFTAPGTYLLELNAFDGEKNRSDTVGIVIRPNDDPIAHWDFEEGSGDTVDDESANNNVGDLAGNSEPNWVSGWVGDWAMEFYANDPATISYVDITSDISTAADPNLETLRYDITLSAWFKIGDLDVTSSPIIVANGDLGWRLYVNHDDGGSVVFTPGDGVAHWQNRTTSVKLLDDGYWHHVVGMYDYANSKSYLYIDGVFEAESSDHVGMMEEADDKPVTIGARATSATEVARGWNGLIDDVQVYSYCISEAKIAELAGMGDLVPQVDAGPDQTVSMLDGPVQLAGTATDDGQPSQLTVEWTSDPCNTGTVTFLPSADIEDPTATFSEAGDYVLHLTADDGHAEVFDEVTITVVNPTCQDIIDDGLLIVGDISGPEGTPDCHVDLYDFAFFAGEWLSCNNPSDPDCEDPF